jgi:predicted O-linked N-acetylglucosamine transferase (SPINDLY family)
VGQDEAAAQYIESAIRLNQGNPAFYSSLGKVYFALRRTDEAVACYQRAVQLWPDFAEAHYELGNLGRIRGRLEEAITSYHRALQVRPDDFRALNNLGVVFKDKGRLEEAIACYRQVVQLRPTDVEPHNNLGIALCDHGSPDAAVACYHQALELKPDYAEAHCNLGVALWGQGKLDEAVGCFRRALKLKPDYAEAHHNLGGALKDQGKLDEAVACYRRALELKPDCAEAHSNLGNALKDRGKLDEAVARYRRALELTPEYAKAHSNLLSTLHYCAGVTPEELAEAHAEFDHRHAAPLSGTIARHENVHGRHGRLRLGFVSPDLCRHPVGSFLVRVLENLSQSGPETICYSDRIVKDDLTHRLQAAATRWRDVIGTSDQRLAEQIRSDGVDILFDLAGHTAHNRLLAFARKPAPIQVTWIGYEGTTGLAAMDYLLADRHVMPPGAEEYCREKVLRMPDGYVTYDPPHDAPPVGALPALAQGHVTFGSFNNPAKITPEVVAVWAKILRRAPAARLLLKYRGLGDEAVKGRYLDLFVSHGVGPHRLEFLPSSSYTDYLATYHRVDVALDPFPFSGSATTCEALWMGVPVVTCPGESFASRHSLSHLSNVGLTETIARDFDEYVELAVSLANDLPRLAALRAGLRERMAASPLCDGKRFAANLMSILQDVWQQRAG